MNKTSIEWTDFSANPLKYRDADGRSVWGCVHASPGCVNCYSETLAHRYGRGGPFNVRTMAGLTPFLDQKELRHMIRAHRIDGRDVSGSKCFVGDMTDIFGEWVPDHLLDRLFAAFALRPDVTWQVLTKRAARMRDYLQSRDPKTGSAHIRVTQILMNSENEGSTPNFSWPLPNVWLGVSVENRKQRDRIIALNETPAAVRFLSLEPLLEDLELSAAWIFYIDWLIAGGESGGNARPCYVAWLRNIVRLGKGTGKPVFMKQLGSNIVTRNDDGWEGDTPRSWPMDTDYDENIHGYRDEYQGADVRVLLRDRKGGDPSEWPEDLRVRQFPVGVSASEAQI